MHNGCCSSHPVYTHTSTAATTHPIAATIHAIAATIHPIAVVMSPENKLMGLYMEVLILLYFSTGFLFFKLFPIGYLP